MSRIDNRSIATSMLFEHAAILYTWFCLHNTSGLLFWPFAYSFSDLSSKIYNTIELVMPSYKEFIVYFLFIFIQLILARLVSVGDYEYGRSGAIVSIDCTDKIIEQTFEWTWTFPFRRIKRETIKDPKEVHLPYRCNGYACFYISICLWVILEVTGLFSISNLVDNNNYGRYIAVTIITSEFLSIICYLWGLVNRGYKDSSSKTAVTPAVAEAPRLSSRETPLRRRASKGNVTPSRRVSRTSTATVIPAVVPATNIASVSRPSPWLADFYFGTMSNVRLLDLNSQGKMDSVDLLMFSELRASWFFAFFLSLAMLYSASSPTLELWLMFIATFLITNARAKFEITLPSLYQNKESQTFGWKTIFWNFSIIPFIYSFNMYLLFRDIDKESHQLGGSIIKRSLPFILFLIGYYIYDTAFSQKYSHKASSFFRWYYFPQLPWADLGSHRQMKSDVYDGCFTVDGWFAFARKMHYSGEILMALSIGLMSCSYMYADGSQMNASGFHICGFHFLLFSIIAYRKAQMNAREDRLCEEKYGFAWKDYKSQVFNAFFPDLHSFIPFLTKGKMPVIR